MTNFDTKALEILTALENNAFYEGTKKLYLSKDEALTSLKRLIAENIDKEPENIWRQEQGWIARKELRAELRQRFNLNGEKHSE